MHAPDVAGRRRDRRAFPQGLSVPVRLRTAAPAAHEPLGKVARTRAFQDSSRVHRPLVPWRYGRRHSAERRQPMIGVRCSGCRPLFSMWRLIPFTRIAATVLATLSVVATPLAGAQAAQSGSAIAGIARDDSGGVLPGVVVTAIANGGGQSQSGVTSGDGRYSLAVPPGVYVVSAELSGLHRSRWPLSRSPWARPPRLTSRSSFLPTAIRWSSPAAAHPSRCGRRPSR